MNNAKIELKFIRSIINYTYTDYCFSEDLEEYYYNKTYYVNDNIKSVFTITKMIKEITILNEHSILEIYDTLYPLFNKKDLDNIKINKLIKYINKNKNEYFKFVKYILKYNIFFEYSYIMANIIFNHFFYLDKGIFLIFHSYLEKQFMTVAKGHSCLTFKSLIQNLMNINEAYNVKKRILSIKDIKEKCKEFDISVLEYMSVERILLFGSYVKGRNNEYSDIDMLVVIDDQKSKITIVRQLMENFINSYFDVTVDVSVIDKSMELGRFEKNIIKYAIPVYEKMGL